MQAEDSSIGPLRQFRLESNIKPKKQDIANLDWNAKILWTQWAYLEIWNGLLYRRNVDKIGKNILQLVAPQTIREHIFKELHVNRTGGHFGRDELLKL